MQNLQVCRVLNLKMNDRKNDPNHLYSRWLSSPPPGDEVVISGMSGRLPESDNIEEFREHLFKKEDMVTDDDRRWKLNHPEIPQRSGKIRNIDKYDAGYFGIHPREADMIDPRMRILMEVVIEAILDAGVNPKELEGTKTGVFLGVDIVNSVTEMKRHGVAGYFNSFLTHAICKFLKIKGPAFFADTACSTSLNVLDLAFRAIRIGQCDNALVGCTNLSQHPTSTHQYFRLGALSSDGTCKVFDQDANGYVRSEAINCMFLQKAKHCRRFYAEIINIKTNSDGFKTEGITYPSSTAQKQLLTEIYEESEVLPSEISFIEAHGTGTVAGDTQEVKAIDSALAQKRNEPVFVGSVKSNIGHCELASGFSSVIKVLIAMESGLIAPNINLTKFKNLPGFTEGRIKVVTDLTEFKNDGIVGINNLGFGGNNAHVILRRHKKCKTDKKASDDFPRLVCVSGRTEEAVQKLLNHNNFDSEYLGLLHQIFKINVPGHLYRGYSVISKSGVVKSCKLWSQSPLYVFFGEFNNSFSILGKYLLDFPIFQDIVSRINKVLIKINAKTLDQILKNLEKTDNSLGSLYLQIALVDLLKFLNVNPSAVYAHSCAKFVVAYYNNEITFEEVLAAVQTTNQNFNTHETMTNFSKNAIIFNISDFYLTNRDMMIVDGNKVMFLEILGRLYQHGYTPQLHKLYPTEYPISRGTAMISPLVKWYHEKSWYIYKFSEFEVSNYVQKEFKISLSDSQYKYIEGHVIDDRNLLPATQYLVMVWETLAQNCRLYITDVSVIFRDCRFIKAILMPKHGSLRLLVTIQKNSGYFEVSEQNSLLVSGWIQSGVEESNLKPLDSICSEMLQQDEIYQELNLRGYNYSGLFKGIEKCTIDGSFGLISWENNWCTFMDQMMQMKILHVDTRLLDVLVEIKKITINPRKHIENINEKNNSLCVNVYHSANIVKAGGIEIRGVRVQSVSKKKPKFEPILEKYLFIPNCYSLSLPDAARVNSQIIVENFLGKEFKAVEMVDDIKNDFVLRWICNDLKNNLMVTPNLTISSTAVIDEIPGVTIEDVTLTSDSKLTLFIGTKVFQRSDLKHILSSLSNDGFVLTRENVTFKPKYYTNFDILTIFTTGTEKLVLLRQSQRVSNTKFVKVSSNSFEWLSEISVKSQENVVLYSVEPEGTLGLINCLRREPNRNNVKCFVAMDELEFDPRNCPEQLKKNMAVNIYKNGTWGTYRHLLLEEVPEVECEHCFAKFTVMGDISSIKWFQGGLSKDTPILKNQNLVSTYYCSVNFKDVIATLGRVQMEDLTNSRLDQENLIGSEFSGRDSSGRRVTGITTKKALSSYIVTDSMCLWNMPDSWSLEDAATVPVVYATVLYSFFMVGEMKRGASVLIHSATGGVGLAALNVCLHYNCDIYVTVGTQEKRDYLKNNYPQILETQVGSSRDTSFQEMIKTATKGRGVDFVLNSLTDDKLTASVRCLAKGGRFLEIGRFDLANNMSLSLQLMEKKASYHGIMLENVIFKSEEKKLQLHQLVADGIKAGFVKPLPRTVFKREKVAASYRHMMTGEHIGKVLIKIRDEESDKNVVPTKMSFLAERRFNCDSRYCYIIIGGLGGFGLELADWLVLRGARKIVLVSRTTILNGYQKQRLRIWESYGVNVEISNKDVTTRHGCEELLTESTKLGHVEAIFNLAVVLKDALFENQTEESFLDCLKPKARATAYLDQLTRKKCLQLRYFVVFSSAASGRGNPGQTNYGMANSIMEKICEKRRLDGLPGLAIQWGAIGDVGAVVKIKKEHQDLVVGGTLQQNVSSCLEVLDKFLTQDHPIVSSIVIPEKTDKHHKFLSAVEAVANILGIRNLKTVSQHATLPELGMDSLMGTEIIQRLEKDYNIYFTVKDLRSLTLTELTEIKANTESEQGEDKKRNNIFVQNIFEFTKSDPLVELTKTKSDSVVFLLPGFEGGFMNFKTLCQELQSRALGVHYDSFSGDTIQEFAVNILPHVEEQIFRDAGFILIGYSFGVTICLELAVLLENKGYTGKLILIDGAPTYITATAKLYFPNLSEEEFQASVLQKIISLLTPPELKQYKEQCFQCHTLSERIDLLMSQIPAKKLTEINFDKEATIALYKRIKAVMSYDFRHKKICSDVYLVKAKLTLVEVGEDYQLSQIAEKRVSVTTIEGNHFTILSKPKICTTINNIITS